VQLYNSFNVALPPDAAWDVLLDMQSMAQCMPGVELTEIVDLETFKGKVSVRLGPIMLTFAGIARLSEMDRERHRARVTAQGTDTKGRGGANANVTFRLELIEGGTKVHVDTDLALSGTVAQYGRGAGMIESVASQLIGQFARNLAAQLQQAAAGPAASEARAPQPPRHPATPIAGLALLWWAFVDFVRNLIGLRRRTF
jgi:carbon monoxide dehydrogenase subunit G